LQLKLFCSGLLLTYPAPRCSQIKVSGRVEDAVEFHWQTIPENDDDFES
jgi:hypothetical protein